MILFLLVALVTRMLVSRLYVQMRIAERTSRQTQSLFEISNGYLTISGLENIMYYGIKSLYRIQEDRCVVYLSQNLTSLSKPYFVEAHFPDPTIIEDGTLAKWCFLNVTPCGSGTSFYSSSKWKYLPIKGNSKALGVMGIYCGDHDIDSEQMVFVDTILFQMATAIEREQLYKNRTEHPEELEAPFDGRLLNELAERLEPATAQLMQTAFSLKQEKDYAEALSLHILAGNLRILNHSQENSKPFDKTMEPVNDVLNEAAALFTPLDNNHPLTLHLGTPQAIPMNRKLILQALCNLLENARNYTPAGTEICLESSLQAGRVSIQVQDVGGGIPADKLAHLFDVSEVPHTIGLGLPVCRAVAEFHHGTFTVENNDRGGVTAVLDLPTQILRRE